MVAARPLLTILVLWASPSQLDGFAPEVLLLATQRTVEQHSTSTLLAKLSMKEKRRKRQNRQQQKITMAGPPVTIEKRESATVQTDDGNQQQQRAREMLDAQRESVKALTGFRQSVEKHLNSTATRDQIQTSGYAVVDDFLESEDLLHTLQEETIRLYQDGSNITRDLRQLGCSMLSLKGGEQYGFAPRCIEWVVALTQHCSSALGFQDKLDNRQSQGSVLFFDRNSRMAALELLNGTDDGKKSGDRDFQPIVEDAVEDLRRLTVVLYLVNNGWGDCGGGFQFQDGSEVEAKKNRLVIINSTQTMFRQDTWRGSEKNLFASALELHIIERGDRQ